MVLLDLIRSQNLNRINTWKGDPLRRTPKRKVITNHHCFSCFESLLLRSPKAATT